MPTHPLKTLQREVVVDLRRVAASLGLKPGYSLTVAAYLRAGGLFRNDAIGAAGGWRAVSAEAGYPSRQGGALRQRHQWKKTRLSLSPRELDAALDAVVGHTPAPRGLQRIMGHKPVKPAAANAANAAAAVAAAQAAAAARKADREAALVRRLDAAMAFIRAHYRDGIGLPEVARAADYSPFHLHRVFHRHFGRTPKQVITELQVAAAQQLLDAGTPLKDIATMTGFAHQSHFTHRFKQLTLTTPSRWIRGERGRPALPPTEAMPEAA